MAQMRNVHEFDGRVQIKDVERFDASEEETALEEFRARPGKLPHVSGMLRDIVLNEQKKNDDLINGYNARHLLASLLCRIKKLPAEDHETWYALLEEQIGDMARLGPCPQGRTIRMWQLYTAL
jgi:hypothetical protein